MAREYKTIDFNYNYTQKDSNYLIEGWANVYNMVDAQNDVVLPQALDKTLEQWKEQFASDGHVLLMLYEHFIEYPAGHWFQFYSDKNKGLFVSGKVTTLLVGGERAVEDMKNNQIGGLSIGYEVNDSFLQDGVRYISDMTLHEVSLVKNPANKDSTVTQMREIHD